MKRFAVGYADFYNNELTITIEESDTWVNAIKQRCLNDMEEEERLNMEGEEQLKNQQEWLDDMDWGDIEVVKQQFFDCDCLIDVMEL